MHSSLPRLAQHSRWKWPHFEPDRSRLSNAPDIIACLTLSYIKEIIPQEEISENESNQCQNGQQKPKEIFRNAVSLAQFWPQNLGTWGQKSNFGFGIAIFVNRAYHQYSRGNIFPIRTTPKNFFVSKLWVIFWGSPLFLAVWQFKLWTPNRTRIQVAHQFRTGLSFRK